MPAPGASAVTAARAAHLPARAELLDELQPAHDRDEEGDDRERAVHHAELPSLDREVGHIDTEGGGDGGGRREEGDDRDDGFAAAALASRTAARRSAGHRRGGNVGAS